MVFASCNDPLKLLVDITLKWDVASKFNQILLSLAQLLNLSLKRQDLRVYETKMKLRWQHPMVLKEWQHGDMRFSYKRELYKVKKKKKKPNYHPKKIKKNKKKKHNKKKKRIKQIKIK